MAGVLDLDAIVVETTEIAKTVRGKRQTWQLRDDIPAEIMLACFRLMAHAEIEGNAISALQSQAQDGDPAAIEAAMAEVQAKLQAQENEVTHICGEIWRHTYPETSDEDIRAWLRADERTRIVQLFFTRRLAESSTLSADTTATPTPNRQQRRANSGSRQGAIPSQKRLSRELRGL